MVKAIVKAAAATSRPRGAPRKGPGSDSEKVATPKGKLSVADYLALQINASDKQQVTLAEECGFTRPNMISMLKSGGTRVPLATVDLIAKALHIDPMHLFRMVLNEYYPELLQIVERLLGQTPLSRNELSLIQFVRGNFNEDVEFDLEGDPKGTKALAAALQNLAVADE